MQVKYTAKSSFMNNYRDGAPFSQKGEIVTTGDGKGGVLLLSIGTDDQVYALRSKSGDLKGWELIPLSACLGEDMQAVAISATVDAQDKPMVCAVFKSKSTSQYLVYFSQVLSADIKKDDWVFRGSKTGVQISNITCGYGKDGSTLIGIITQQGNKTDAFLVNPNIRDQSWLWREVPCPVNSLGVIDFKIGHQSKLESIDGVEAVAYVLYETAKDETALVLTSLPDTTIFNHLVQTDLNPTAFSLIEDVQNDSQLLIGKKDLYLISPAAQLSKDKSVVSQGATKLNKTAFSDPASKIESGRLDGDDLQVWVRTKGGDLFQSKSSNRVWDNFFPFEKEIELLASWRHGGNAINDVFYVSLGQQLFRYSQEPVTTRWMPHPVAVPSLGHIEEVSSYTTHLNVTDADGNALVDHPVTINCSELSMLKINNDTYYVGQGERKAVVRTDSLGNILIENTVDSLVTPTLRISIDGLDTPFDLNPMHEVQNKLAGITAQGLKSAQMQTTEYGRTEPLFKDMTDEEAQHAADSLKGLTQVANKLPSNAFPNSPPLHNAVHLMAVEKMLKAPTIRHDKLGPLFGIDFTQGRPRFTTDHHTLQNVHLKHYNMLMARAAADGMLESFGDSITHFFGDMWHSIKKGLIAVGHLVVQAVEKGFELVVSLLDGTVFKALVHFAEQAWEVVSHVLEKIGAAIMDALKWLGELFAWTDILRTHDVIRSLINIGMDTGKDALVDAARQVNLIFNQVRGSISKANGYKDSKSPYLTMSAKSANARNRRKNPLGDPQSNWAISKLTSSNSLAHAPDDKTANQKMDDEFMKAVDDIKKIMAQAGKEVKTGFESGSIEDILKSLLNLLEEAIISAAELVVQGILNLAEKLLDLLQTVLNHRWDIPLLTPLYEKVIVPGSKLSLLDLISLVIAIPATVIYKAAQNSAPFDESISKAITKCKTFDQVLAVFGAPATISKLKFDSLPKMDALPQMRMQNLGAMYVSNPNAVTAMASATSPAPDEVKKLDYALGYISGVSTVIYGIANGIGAVRDAPVTGKIKLPTGILACVCGIISMGIKLGYPDEYDKLGWYRYEMFVTVYQALFSVNDGLAVAYPEIGIVGKDDMSKTWGCSESILGILNLIFFIVLVCGDEDGRKFFQNVALSLAQILAGPTARVDDPDLKLFLAAMISCANTGSGVGNIVRTDEAAVKGSIHVNV